MPNNPHGHLIMDEDELIYVRPRDQQEFTLTNYQYTNYMAGLMTVEQLFSIYENIEVC